MNDDVRDVIAAGIRHRLSDAQRAHKVDIDFAMDVLGTLNKAGMRIIPCTQHEASPLPDDIAGLIERLHQSWSPGTNEAAAALERMAQENERLWEIIGLKNVEIDYLQNQIDKISDDKSC